MIEEDEGMCVCELEKRFKCVFTQFQYYVHRVVVVFFSSSLLPSFGVNVCVCVCVCVVGE